MKYTVLWVVFVAILMLPSSLYAQEPLTDDTTIQSELGEELSDSSSDRGPCTVTATLPYRWHDGARYWIVANGIANCSTGGQHTMRVCLREDRWAFPDRDVSCSQTSGSWTYKSLSAVGCLGPSNTNYYTRVIFDGVTYDSARFYNNC